MDLKFEVSTKINRPVETVFEAVADPEQLSKYFASGGAKGRMESGVTVHWAFEGYCGDFPVKVIEVEKNRRIVFQWEAGDPVDLSMGYDTTVTMRFEPTDDGKATILSIAEEGWKEDASGLRASYSNCGGWTHMLNFLKVYLEHDIILRDETQA